METTNTVDSKVSQDSSSKFEQSLEKVLIDISHNFLILDDLYTDSAHFIEVEKGLNTIVISTFHSLNMLMSLAITSKDKQLHDELSVLLVSYMSMGTSYLNSFFGFKGEEEECKYNTLMGMSDENMDLWESYKNLYDKLVLAEDLFVTVVNMSGFSSDYLSLLATDARLALTGVAYRSKPLSTRKGIESNLVYSEPDEVINFSRYTERLEEYVNNHKAGVDGVAKPVLPVRVLGFVNK